MGHHLSLRAGIRGDPVAHAARLPCAGRKANGATCAAWAMMGTCRLVVVVRLSAAAPTKAARACASIPLYERTWPELDVRLRFRVQSAADRQPWPAAPRQAVYDSGVLFDG